MEQDKCNMKYFFKVLQNTSENYLILIEITLFKNNRFLKTERIIRYNILKSFVLLCKTHLKIRKKVEFCKTESEFTQ